MLKLSIAIAAATLLTASPGLAQDASAPAALSAASFSVAANAPRVDDISLPRRGKLVQHHGFYAAPSFGVTMLNHDVAPVVGVRSAWIANRTLGVGFAFNALANHVDQESNYRGRALGGYGGLLLQYLIGAEQRVHGSVDTTIGGGVICQQTGSEDNDDCNGHGFFALEPMAHVEVNVVTSVRVSLGAGYRLAVPANESPLSSNELGGFVGKLALQFGAF